MSDPTLSDIDFNNTMVWIWTNLKNGLNWESFKLEPMWGYLLVDLLLVLRLFR